MQELSMHNVQDFPFRNTAMLIKMLDTPTSDD